MDDDIGADPTPEEIAALCLAIQKTWSNGERLKRIWSNPTPIDCPPSVRLLASDHAAVRLERERAG